MAISLTAVRADPEGAAATITETIAGVTIEILSANGETVIFRGTFEPPQAFEQAGYPTEHARLAVLPSRRPVAVPEAAHNRPWRHRNPGAADGGLGELCLWFDDDPAQLRWTWADGFDGFVRLVHRHLVYEEFFRRHGYWPAEEAPHGHGDHPIIRLETRWETFRRKRS